MYGLKILPITHFSPYKSILEKKKPILSSFVKEVKFA